MLEITADGTLFFQFADKSFNLSVVNDTDYKSFCAWTQYWMIDIETYRFDNEPSISLWIKGNQNSFGKLEFFVFGFWFHILLE